jgi:hypothetical protein
MRNLARISVALCFAVAQEPAANKVPPEAQAFVDRANAQLLKVNTGSSRADWRAEKDVTDDTIATSARLNEKTTSLTLRLTAESHRSYGSKAADAKLNTMLEAGQSRPWQQTLKEMTGADHLDAQAMPDYFAPLYVWLKDQNKSNPQ